MRKRMATRPWLAAVALVLAGCFGGGNDPSPNQKANSPPTASAGTDQTVTVGTTVTLTGSAADTDGSIASHAWSQTSGPAVTLANANSATATFTAPVEAATLVFTLTVTDDQGAIHTDSVTVTVTLVVNPPPPIAPKITRQPNDVLALEHGAAMMMVAASGNNLNYEWRRASGTVVKTGPEPFYFRTGLFTSDDGDCYYVVVSNSLGTATSDQACLTVEDIDWNLDPSDDPENGDDRSYALGFGGALMKLTQAITGPLTGGVGPGSGLRLGFPLQFGPPENCSMGSFGGTTLDGVMVAPGATLPLGKHTLSESWDECRADLEDNFAKTGTYMVEYDFPQTWGVGTLTLHISEPYINGTLQATVTSTGTGGSRIDQIEITIAEDFSFGDLETTGAQEIEVERRYRSDGLAVDEIFIEFDVIMRAYDQDGSAGMLGIRHGDFFHLRQHFDEGDSGGPQYTISGTMVVSMGQYALATLEPMLTGTGWGFHVIPDEECPEGYTCADLPDLP